MTKHRAAALLLIAGALAASDALAISKCVDKAGKVTYQDGKCPDDVRQDPLDIRVPPPPRPAAATPGGLPPPPNDPQFNAAEQTIAAYESCSAQDPEFGNRHIVEFEAWKKLNARIYGRVRRDDDAADRIKAEVAKAKSARAGFTPEQAKTQVDFCEASVPALLSREVEKFFPPVK